MKLHYTKEIQQWDQFTIEQEPVTSLELMERAAAACSRWIMNRFPEQTPVKIFCGTGNNGGDGLVIAQHLDKARYKAEVYILEGTKRSSDFKYNLKEWEMQRGQKVKILKGNDFPEIDKNDLVIDALYGTGFKGELEATGLHLVQHINQSAAVIVSVDVPSGLNPDEIIQPGNGEGIIQATHTLTFQVPKYSFLFPENGVYTGFVHVLPIGLHPQFKADGISGQFYTDIETAREIFKPRGKFNHKGTFGHALLIAGSKGKYGAALLAAQACLRSGAGLLTVHVPVKAVELVHQFIPEAMVHEDGSNDHFSAIESEELLACGAIGIGPGLGTNMQTKKALLKLITEIKKPMVLDADALNLIAEEWKAGNNIRLPEGSVLTPHPKEFERLAGACANSMERLKLLKEFAIQHKLTVVLKGAHTLVADATGVLNFNGSGNPSLAKGGTGDALCGIILALLAQGYPSVHAAMLGVFLHGLAADCTTTSMGMESVLATDIITKLPEAFRLISLRNRTGS